MGRRSRGPCCPHATWLDLKARDAPLERAAARHAVQLACYADLLAGEKGATLRDMDLVVGDGSCETLRCAHIAYS